MPQPPRERGRLWCGICESSTAMGNTNSAAARLLHLHSPCLCPASGWGGGKKVPAGVPTQQPRPAAGAGAGVRKFFHVNRKMDRFPPVVEALKLFWI